MEETDIRGNAVKAKDAKRWLKNALGDAILLAHPDSAPLPMSQLTRLHVVLGTPCNCRCSMCYQTDFRSVMDPAILETSLSPLFPHLREIILQGGEPTILPQTRRFADRALQANPQVRFALFTNGQRFDAEWTEFFLEHGSYVNFSINAATEPTYRRIVSGDADWNRLLDNLRAFDAARRARAAAPRLQTSFVATDDNLSETAAFLEFSRTLGADSIHYFFDPSRLPRDRERARQELQEARAWRQTHPEIPVEGLDMLSHHLLGTPPVPPVCTWPIDSLYVDVDGETRFCCLIDRSLGNLAKADVGKLWNGWRARRLRRMVREGNLRFCGAYCRPGRRRP